LGSVESDIFLRARLDDPNRIESFKEIKFLAQTIFSKHDPEGDVIPGRCASKSAVADLDDHICRTRVNPSSDIEPGISRFRVWSLRTIPE
jgi:hypothetical protein